MTDDPANLGDLAAFVTTVQAGGFSAAARRMGRSRSAVAKAVARLETRLGTRLMTRSTRRLALTEEGRRFQERCAQLLGELQEAEADVSAHGARPRGALRLALPDAYGRKVLLPVVARYLAIHHDVKVELSLSDQVGSLVEQGWDLSVRMGLPSDLPPELIARVIDRAAHVFVASPGYLDARGAPESVEDLAAHQAVTYRRAGRRAHWRMLTPAGEWRELPCSARVAVDSTAGVIAAARLGLGIAYTPRVLVEDSLASGALSPILSQLPLGVLPVTALFQGHRTQPAKVRAFLDLLKGAPSHLDGT